MTPSSFDSPVDPPDPTVRPGGAAYCLVICWSAVTPSVTVDVQIPGTTPRSPRRSWSMSPALRQARPHDQPRARPAEHVGIENDRGSTLICRPEKTHVCLTPRSRAIGNALIPAVPSPSSLDPQESTYALPLPPPLTALVDRNRIRPAMTRSGAAQRHRESVQTRLNLPSAPRLSGFGSTERPLWAIQFESLQEGCRLVCRLFVVFLKKRSGD